MSSPTRDYLNYILEHKKDVYQGGRELGLSRAQLLLHDYSKFYPKSFITYRDYWFGPEGVHAQGGRDKVSPELTSRFRTEAQKHMNRERHHMHKRTKNPVPLEEVPLKYRKEMLADWYAVNKRTAHNLNKELPTIKNWAQQQNLKWMLEKTGQLEYYTPAIKQKAFGDGMHQALDTYKKQTATSAQFADRLDWVTKCL